MKVYTTVNTFLLPIGFRFGGWLFSPGILILIFLLETIGALKLC
jgi:hypothetical protein